MNGSPPYAPASLRRRLASLFYEALLLAALWVVAGFLLLPFIVFPAALSAQALTVLSLPARTLSFVYYFSLGALYFGWSWSAGRRTLPMKTWRLLLVEQAGTPLSSKRALTRYLAAWIGPLTGAAAYAGVGRWALLMLGANYAWALVDPDRQFLHDRLAGTQLRFAPAR